MSRDASNGDGKGGDERNSGSHARDGKPDGKSASGAKSGRASGGARGSGSSRKMKSSSGSLRQSSIFRAAEWLGRGASVWSLPVSAVMRRHGQIGRAHV